MEEIKIGKIYTIDCYNHPIKVIVIGKRKTFFGEKIFWEENAQSFYAKGCDYKKTFLRKIIKTDN